MPDPIEVRKVPIESVTDASGLSRLIADGVIEAERVLAVIGKTEGNGGVNDYTRILADRAFREVLAEHGHPAPESVPLVWSGGTDGILSPHATIFATTDATTTDATTTDATTTDATSSDAATDEPRLSVGVAMSEVILPEDIGRPAMVEKVAAGVREAMKIAGIDDPRDVHYVQTKTPLLTLATITDARRRGHDTAIEETGPSMDLSNSTTALGIAVALGEIEMPRADQIHKDLSLYSSVASCSSGVELDRAQIVLVGNVRGIGGRYRIGHSVMKDALDADGIWAAIRDSGLPLPERPHPSDLGGRLVNVFMKCEADPSGRVRGRRNIMLDDSDVHWHRQIKAAVGGVAASVTGDPAVFVSVAAVHQGPSGGGPVAAIADLG
ncbi:ring-opening amidohydrolase [Nonomuraea aridisoli]|uniref:Barbiturase n=1 Tax=Nonomuraea aridisoli TaxID=2070368 RepID=A0A2W2E5C6_9ACTN|nr:ring-opening amidohydrolase [Nonomuraea aridisoli]PZG07238.1 barbiturase [Nonomuraea aridisoli]